MTRARSEQQLLTPEEVAKQCRASPGQVQRWMRERQLGYIDFPRGRRIPEAALAEFLAERTVAPARHT